MFSPLIKVEATAEGVIKSFLKLLHSLIANVLLEAVVLLFITVEKLVAVIIDAAAVNKKVNIDLFFILIMNLY